MFAPDERFELIDGELIEKTIQNSPHATGVSLCDEALRAILPKEVYIRTRPPPAIGEHSQPDPDLAVVRGSARDYEYDHPTTAELVIEVSDTSLSYDRTVKAGLYARAGVPEHWILNLNDRLLEVQCLPAPLSAEPGGYHYLSIERRGEAEAVTPSIAPDSSIQISDLLPRLK